MLDRLLREHDAIRAFAAKFEAYLNEDLLTDVDGLAAVRWDMTKVMMQHLAFEDRFVNLPLERDPRPHAAAIAQRFKRDLEAIQTSFEGHMERWSSAKTAADWVGYRRISLPQLRTLTGRMRREEDELFPLIAGCAEIASGSVPGPERNWARSAWDVQTSLGKR